MKQLCIKQFIFKEHHQLTKAFHQVLLYYYASWTYFWCISDFYFV